MKTIGNWLNISSLRPMLMWPLYHMWFGILMMTVKYCVNYMMILDKIPG